VEAALHPIRGEPGSVTADHDERVSARRLLRYLLILGCDSLITALALWCAFALRFDGRIPRALLDALPFALGSLIALRASVAIVFRLYGWSFQTPGLLEAMRLAAATVSGTALFVVCFRMAASGGPVLPRSVVALEFFLTTTLMAAYRFGPRLYLAWSNDWRCSHSAAVRRTLVVGAGHSGDLLLRDLSGSSEHPYFVVGVVDDDPAKAGTSVGGKPVLGCISDLTQLIGEHRVDTVMLAIPSLAGERVRDILRLCSSHKASFKIVRPSFAGHRRNGAATLHDLSPDDLLPRDQVAFDPAEARALLAGRRIVVTGGAGSIGGEIAHQAAGLGASLVVLVDMNENEMYLRYRRLREQFPDVEFRAEVADVREPVRLLQLGEECEPDYVFHAAAHKHVPLMEDAPEEAIKNNVFGTQNVARMASACGAARMVFISTDKAVNPSSVMGASKRIAELVVRDLARTSRTRMTAVRFGNVLGSAGSVVPIFKEQIERGGPVTVTHADCTRYFMTISEAVGLVLVAGLGGYGELCVLDMGQPIRIADLAANMITMAGYIPGLEIPIVYQGLRPGEKLHEEPLTEDEERAHVVRSRIKVAKSPPPPEDLEEHLRDLRRAAHAGDRESLMEVVRALVPTYRECGTRVRSPAAVGGPAPCRPVAALASVTPISAAGTPGGGAAWTAQ
jgi:FlaA1/EpsC-like NDP-sugar epimerase